LRLSTKSAAKIAQDTHPQIDTAHGTLNSEVMFETAARLRAAAKRPENFRDANAAALAKAFDCWRDREFPKRRETVAQIASAWSYTAALLDESLDALLEPFRTSALRSFGAKVPSRRDVIGFIMPGNVPGAGLHEFSTALIAGSGLIVKTSSAEPLFFGAFARTIAEIAPQVGARIAVFNWSRGQTYLTRAFRTACDWIVAFGNDATLAGLTAAEIPSNKSNCPNTQLVGFGSRVSGALVMTEALRDSTEVLNALARDITLFEQRGCLSPHHIFVEGSGARAFAAELATALDRAAGKIPPPHRYGLEDAAAVRRVRENARWRALGGQDVALWEGARLGWTVVYDSSAHFRVSPSWRTVYVSAVASLDDFIRRVEPASGRLEACAIAGPASRVDQLTPALDRLGVSYICAPGAMQSPPLEWRHGGGAFLVKLLDRKLLDRR
jgi:acyl-CoA reductase-like NAD-dependent aldehyde dehydrogenase